MIDPEHDLPIQQQAEVLGISRSTVYYEPRPISDEDLWLMRRIDELHLNYPCVWIESNATLTFTQTNEWGLSTIDAFRSSDGYSKQRKNGKKCEVRTISLTDMLEKYNAPRMIDYLSIDTEGGEFDIGLFRRQCLGTRRIGDIATLRDQAKAWNRRVNRDKITIKWKFTRKLARLTLNYLIKRS
jgi:FkbM family methyltransferase